MRRKFGIVMCIWVLVIVFEATLLGVNSEYDNTQGFLMYAEWLDINYLKKHFDVEIVNNQICKTSVGFAVGFICRNPPEKGMLTEVTSIEHTGYQDDIVCGVCIQVPYGEKADKFVREFSTKNDYTTIEIEVTIIEDESVVENPKAQKVTAFVPKSFVRCPGRGSAVPLKSTVRRIYCSQIKAGIPPQLWMVTAEWINFVNDDELPLTQCCDF